ncbi:hypothetical protein LEP1GSC036_0651 [Leptospira weilii str. 2006001853]|uniref:Uncharacterized protein n=1 Tax=Leptospira weilii str. 2006001853 TaxID=1001589 RepID=A0A828Z913_9LEPT|nr:hypothetical protein LEP1GSC036_0651 [Leptospira weilii str. 2006001853]EMJ60432.1 hypothetical protein LEP1GSC051_3398 [Leptospira sp. P2653]EMN44679.1 hypothetical protein LEP1GSC086_4251 [Leptospira weilii str. LNT 1234]
MLTLYSTNLDFYKGYSADTFSRVFKKFIIFFMKLNISEITT